MNCNKSEYIMIRPYSQDIIDIHSLLMLILSQGIILPLEKTNRTVLCLMSYTYMFFFCCWSTLPNFSSKLSASAPIEDSLNLWFLSSKLSSKRSYFFLLSLFSQLMLPSSHHFSSSHHVFILSGFVDIFFKWTMQKSCRLY